MCLCLLAARPRRGCRLHVAFHGCLQSEQAIGDKFYAHAGYNRWAATNRIIVLYPQTVASHSAPFNPNGCWASALSEVDPGMLNKADPP